MYQLWDTAQFRLWQTNKIHQIQKNTVCMVWGICFQKTVYPPCNIFIRTFTTPLQSAQTRPLALESRASMAQLRISPSRRSGWPDNLATDCLNVRSRKLWQLYSAQFSKYTVGRVYVYVYVNVLACKMCSVLCIREKVTEEVRFLVFALEFICCSYRHSGRDQNLVRYISWVLAQQMLICDAIP